MSLRSTELPVVLVLSMACVCESKEKTPALVAAALAPDSGPPPADSGVKAPTIEQAVSPTPRRPAACWHTVGLEMRPQCVLGPPARERCMLRVKHGSVPRPAEAARPGEDLVERKGVRRSTRS
jgi:hypothetical protein